MHSLAIRLIGSFPLTCLYDVKGKEGGEWVTNRARVPNSSKGTMPCARVKVSSQFLPTE